MAKVSRNIVATLALLTMMAAGGNFARAQSTAKQRSAPVVKADAVQLQTSAGQATGRIQASTADKKELVDSVRSKNQDTIKAVLLRNGFTAEQLKDAKIVLNDNTGGKGGAEREKLKATTHGAESEKLKITIKGSCCPMTITITINF